MTPAEVSRSYDVLAAYWAEPRHPLSGLEAHQRALGFLNCSSPEALALDVGCGCNGRFLDLLRTLSIRYEGIDFSSEMIRLARQRDPGIMFHQANIITWRPSRSYHFISAWDSIWHVPLSEQAQVLEKLCGCLMPGGVIIFTLGGQNGPSEVRDSAMGPPMYHATLGIPATLAVLHGRGCICRHLEFDQWPEKHTYIIAQLTS